MNPMLYELDSVVDIVPLNGTLKKNDVALYECERQKRCVLHRVIEVKDGYYIFRGDNCLNDEIVPFDKVMGVAAQFKRRSKDDWVSVESPKYLRYVRFLNYTWFIRKPIFKLRAFILNLRRRVGATQIGKKIKARGNRT